MRTQEAMAADYGSDRAASSSRRASSLGAPSEREQADRRELVLRRYAELYEYAPISYFTFDRDGLITDVNRQAAQVLGMTRDDLVRQPFGRFVTPETVPAFENLLESVFARGGKGACELEIAAPGRAPFPAQIEANVEGSGDGCCRAVLLDVSDRKQAEALIRGTRDYMQKLIQTANVMIIGLNASGRIEVFNEAAERLTGYTRGELEGRNWFEVLVPRDRYPRVWQEFNRLKAGGLPRAFENPILTKAGEERLISWANSELRDGDRFVGSISFGIDVTERKESERKLAQARDEALDALRLKSEFLANISHEVRTPLNGIVGMTVLLLDSGLTPVQRSYAETIQSSSEALLAIINDILDFSRMEAGKLTFEDLDFDLQTTVESTVQLLAERAQRKQVELVLLIDADVPTKLRGDPGRLRQVITNLLVNAVKFTEQGEVVVRISREQETESDVSLCCTVKDTGIGIAPEALPFLFQAFAQVDGSTSRKYGGSGLGLAISKQLVEIMGGQIGVESTLGAGSTFWFTLRLAKQTATAPPPGDQRDRVAGLHVLIVDDNAAGRAGLAQQLEALRVTAAAAPTGAEAVRLLREAAAVNQPFDLAVLSMQLPDTDGLALARSIGADPSISSTRFLMVAAMGASTDTAILRVAGVGAFLFKPVQQEALIQGLASAMGLGSPHETRFRLHRPPDPAGSGGMPGAPRPFHILVAEDNPINQRVALGLLEKLGYRGEAVASGHEVLRAVRLVPYQVILMDCQLPELDGYEAARRIRREEAQNDPANPRRVHIIAMTADATPGARERCLASGMDDYLSKPVHLQALQSAMERAQAVCLPEGAPTPPSRAETDIVDPQAFEALAELRRSGEPDVLAEVIRMFLADTPSRLAAMQTSITRYERSALATAAHSLAGSAETLGARKLAALCREIEQSARAGAIQVAAQLHRRLEEEYQQVRSVLDSRLAASKPGV